MWPLPEAWHVLVTLGQAQHSCAGDLQLSLGLSGCLVHPVPLPRSVLCTGSAWACTCPRRCFGRAVQIPCSALMQTCLSRRRDVELQFPSYWRRLHFNTALKPEAIIPQIGYPGWGCSAPRSPRRWTKCGQVSWKAPKVDLSCFRAGGRKTLPWRQMHRHLPNAWSVGLCRHLVTSSLVKMNHSAKPTSHAGAKIFFQRVLCNEFIRSEPRPSWQKHIVRPCP